MNDALSPPTKVVFVAGGQGSQFLGMGLDLYNNDDQFRSHLQTALPSDEPTLDNIRVAWESQDSRSLNNTAYVQTLLAALGFASARRLFDLGVIPDVLLGHSAGEFALACASGLVDDQNLPDVLRRRAQFLEDVNVPGTMVAIRAPEHEVQRLIDETRASVALATINSPTQCVVAGNDEAVAAFCEAAKQRSFLTVYVDSELPFHSPLMLGQSDDFARILSETTLRPPAHPLFSTFTCSWLTDAEAGSARFWASHLSRPVRFWSSVDFLLCNGDCLFVDLGPGTSLSAALGSHSAVRLGSSRVIPMMPQRSSSTPSYQLWLERAQALAEIGSDAEQTDG